jgi:hypothetical protein
MLLLLNSFDPELNNRHILFQDIKKKSTKISLEEKEKLTASVILVPAQHRLLMTVVAGCRQQ